jgi:hypothetical protein
VLCWLYLQSKVGFITDDAILERNAFLIAGFDWERNTNHFPRESLTVTDVFVSYTRQDETEHGNTKAR